MEVVSQIDERLAQIVPLYSEASIFAQAQYHKTLSTLNNIYTTSEARVRTVTNATKGFKNQAMVLCSQSADDLLDYIEDKLTIEGDDLLQKDKVKRVVKILNHLKEEIVCNPIQHVSQLSDSLIKKGKALGQEYILPLFITFKATVLVSR